MPEIQEKCDPGRKLEEGNDKEESPWKLQKVCKHVIRYYLIYGTQSTAHDTKQSFLLLMSIEIWTKHDNIMLHNKTLTKTRSSNAVMNTYMHIHKDRSQVNVRLSEWKTFMCMHVFAHMAVRNENWCVAVVTMLLI